MSTRTHALGALAVAALASMTLSAAPASAFRYVTKEGAVTNGQSTLVKRGCPGTMHAVGGGIKAEKFHEQHVSSVGPFDGGDPDDIADDGWAARVDGFAVGELELKLFAICGRGAYEHVQHLDFPIPASTDLSVFSGYCFPGTRPIGGGGYASAPWGTMRVTSTKPFDGPDQDLDPDDAWTVGARNKAGQVQNLDAIAICGEGKYEYPQESRAVDASQEGQARVRCPKGTRLA
jgi:hypothetical protein